MIQNIPGFKDLAYVMPDWAKVQTYLLTLSRRHLAAIAEFQAASVTDTELSITVTATARTSGIELTWTQVAGAKRYQIYRGTTSDFSASTRIATREGVASTSYFDVGDQLTAGLLYYWVRAVDDNDEGPIGMTSINNVSLPGGGLMGLPFEGPLGSGRHGALSITTNTTATESIPIYQLTTFEVTAGDTWTAKAQNPGGFIVAVRGRATIAGTIDVSGRGAAGGPAVDADSIGKNGQNGFHLGGSGGGGAAGGGGIAASRLGGGHGGPTKAGVPLGNWDQSLQVRQATHTTWYGTDAAGPTDADLRSEAGTALLNGGAGASNATADDGGGGAAVSNYGMGAAGLEALGNMQWALFRSLLFGWGAGGGSGGAQVTVTNTSGAGGNGGGCFVLLCDELDFTGTINALGADGGDAVTTGGNKGAGGGGGGGGGVVIIGYRTLIAGSGAINVAGGTGGLGAITGAGAAGNGGDGGDGYGRIFDMRI